MANQLGSSAQRIRIGLTGLAFAFLLVLLGSIISRSSQEEQPVNASAQNVADPQEKEPSDSLGELGVAPGAGEMANNASDTAKQ